MKKILVISGFFILCNLLLNVSAELIYGTGDALLTGYDVGAARAQEDVYMASKSYSAKTEFMHTQQTKEASRQAEKRKKEDKRLSGTLRASVVATARERADKNAVLEQLQLKNINVNDPLNKENIEKIYSQMERFVNSKTYSGQVIDNKYVAKVEMDIDSAKFWNLVKIANLGSSYMHAQKTQKILIVMDEFLGAPADMHTQVLSKEVITYDHNYSEKEKDAVKASAKDSYNGVSASGYSGYYGASGAKTSVKSNSNYNYGELHDYAKNENTSFRHIREYAPKNPNVQQKKMALSVITKVLGAQGITTVSDTMFRSAFLQGRNISAVDLTDTKQIQKYVDFARDVAHVDYLGIGLVTYVDNGNGPTGREVDGQINVEVFSTATGSWENLASEQIDAKAGSSSVNSAMSEVAGKLGTYVGNSLVSQIQNKIQENAMYGTTYSVEIRWLTSMEMGKMYDALSSINGVVGEPEEKSSSCNCVTYSIMYNGKKPLKYAILNAMATIAPKFNSYKADTDRNQIIIHP